MRLVTQTRQLAESFGDEECIRILAKAGFDAIDWSFFAMIDGQGIWFQPGWQEHAKNLKALAQECGIAFSQAHAPFPSSRGEEPFDTTIRQYILRSMEAAALMGAGNIIVHPLQHLTYSKNRAQLFEENITFYRSLIPACQEYGIRVCAENMWQYDSKRGHIIDSVCSQPEEFCALLDTIDNPWVVGCLDIGHCALVGQEPADFIRALGPKRLQALHVHDVDYRHDNHTLPYLQSLDWESITAALAEIHYTGDFTFEADCFLTAFPAQLQPEASAFMAKTGRHLISLIEAAAEPTKDNTINS